MKTIDYTPREILEIRGSLTYFIGLCVVSAVSAGFQIIARVELMGILRPAFMMAIYLVMAWIVYRRKLNRKTPGVFPWIAGFLTVAAPIFAKYNYAKEGG